MRTKYVGCIKCENMPNYDILNEAIVTIWIGRINGSINPGAVYSAILRSGKEGSMDMG